MKYKALIALIPMLCAVYCDLFSSSATCCTACPEYSATSSPFVPNKLKLAIGNCISKNLTVSNLVNTLRSIHINYTNFFLVQLQDFDQRKGLGFASCPTDVTDTGQTPYSSADNNTINMFFDSVIDVVNNNSFNSSSPNFANTYSNFVQQL
jgi:hypothetical protein